MNNLIDTNLDASDSVTAKRGLNGYLLAAYLLCMLGMSNLNFITIDIHTEDSGTNSMFILFALNMICLIGVALLSDFIRQGRVLNIVGIGLFILLGILSWSSDSLTGYPLAILFYLATGLVTFPLLRRLVANTEFFGKPQQIILLSISGAHLVNSLFFQISHTVDQRANDNGPLLVGSLLLIIALIMILIDDEKEDELQTSLNEYTAQHPGFWTHSILPLAGVMLLSHWISAQPQRIYYYEAYLNRDSGMQPLLSFVNLMLGGGLLALLIFAGKIRNQWIYIGSGAGLLVLLILASLSMGEEYSATMIWAFALTGSLGATLVFFGISLWLYKYTSFPFFATLLAFEQFLEYVAYLITDYFNLYVTKMHFQHYNF